MSLLYKVNRWNESEADRLITSGNATQYMGNVAGLKVDDVKEVKESRGKFHIICDGFKIVIDPDKIGYWMLHNCNGERYSCGEKLAVLVEAAAKLVGKGRTVTVDCQKPAVTVAEGHVKVSRERWCTKLHVKNQDGKWILQTGTRGGEPDDVADAIIKRLKEGLAHDRPLTKKEMLENGLPDPHTFDTDDRLTEEDGRGTWGHDDDGTWIRVREGLLDKIRVDGVVTINSNRTVREAIDPSGKEAWFRITCQTKTRSIRFVVLSDGEQYYIMSKIGAKYKVVESTQINSLVDAGDMTKIDQTMIKEAMASYVADLQLV